MDIGDGRGSIEGFEESDRRLFVDLILRILESEGRVLRTCLQK